MADHRFGVVIIGAGIIGTSIAYHLARMGRPDVAVLEKEPSAGMGSTAKAAGGIRAQFSSGINIELSRLSIERFERISGRSLDVRRLAPVAGDQRRTNADTTRIRGELGWEPHVSLEDGLRRQWEWASSRVAAG